MQVQEQQSPFVDGKLHRREQSRQARYSLLERLCRMDRNTVVGAYEVAAILDRAVNTVNQWCTDSPHKLPPRITGHGRSWRLGTVLDWVQERDQKGRGTK